MYYSGFYTRTSILFFIPYFTCYRNKVDIRGDDLECTSLQYQTSDVQVFTKFYTVHQRRDVYMRGGKVEVFADITQYVRHLVQTSDRDVVRFEDGLIRGVSPGKAVVKVCEVILWHVSPW